MMILQRRAPPGLQQARALPSFLLPPPPPRLRQGGRRKTQTQSVTFIAIFVQQINLQLNQYS